ncbi:MAG TPA: NADH-quinone oxidoreductase subunit J [Thermoanaerobaculia bacterium]|nr:NADH-quinone oxidoreductase subunit J [Thermoanaerobaculia bacterium]
MEYIVFFFFAAVAVIFALVVILHRNPVVGALSLVVSFFALAVMYVLLDAPFLAALQVIVYAGAIMVLFLFVIMLLNLQHTEEPATRPIQQFLGYAGSAAFGLALVYYLSKYAVFALIPDTPFASDARSLGVRLFEAYVFPFEMVSILLLSAIVGALVLSGRVGQRPSLTAEATPASPGEPVTPIPREVAP